MHTLVSGLATAASQVDAGDVEVVNVREADGRLGPLIIILVALGILTLVATAMYWWTTRPSRTITFDLTQGADNG